MLKDLYEKDAREEETPRVEWDKNNPYLGGGTSLRRPRIIAVDFDGTLCVNKYPAIGEPKAHVIESVKEFKRNGDIIILWTCRVGDDLKAAIDWCERQGIVFDYVNRNTDQNIAFYGNDSRKINADVYLDNKAKPPAFIMSTETEFDTAEEKAERVLCANCPCPKTKQAGFCCACDVFYALRDYYIQYPDKVEKE